MNDNNTNNNDAIKHHRKKSIKIKRKKLIFHKSDTDLIGKYKTNAKNSNYPVKQTRSTSVSPRKIEENFEECIKLISKVQNILNNVDFNELEPKVRKQLIEDKQCLNYLLSSQTNNKNKDNNIITLKALLNYILDLQKQHISSPNGKNVFEPNRFISDIPSQMQPGASRLGKKLCTKANFVSRSTYTQNDTLQYCDIPLNIGITTKSRMLLSSGPGDTTNANLKKSIEQHINDIDKMVEYKDISDKSNDYCSNENKIKTEMQVGQDLDFQYLLLDQNSDFVQKKNPERCISAPIDKKDENGLTKSAERAIGIRKRHVSLVECNITGEIQNGTEHRSKNNLRCNSDKYFGGSYRRKNDMMQNSSTNYNTIFDANKNQKDLIGDISSRNLRTISNTGSSKKSKNKSFILNRNRSDSCGNSMKDYLKKSPPATNDILKTPVPCFVNKTTIEELSSSEYTNSTSETNSLEYSEKKDMDYVKISTSSSPRPQSPRNIRSSPRPQSPRNIRSSPRPQSPVISRSSPRIDKILNLGSSSERKQYITNTKDPYEIDTLDINRKTVELHETIGNGATGIVKRATYKYMSLACKILHIECLDIPRRQRIVDEFEMMCKFNHKNIVKYFGFDIETDPNLQYYLFMEYFSKSLKDLIVIKRKKYDCQPIHALCENPSLDILLLINFATQIINGIIYLHNKNIVHRDLKSDNIFLHYNDDEEYKSILKIGDFGDSKKIKKFSLTGQRQTLNIGTIEFMAPELCSIHKSEMKTNALFGSANNDLKKVDVWSFGGILIEMMTLDIPYRAQHSDKFQIFKDIYQGVRPEFDTEFIPMIKNEKKRDKWVNLVELYEKCTEKNPKSRISSKEILEFINKSLIK